jgi:hypothetical protein
LHWNRRVLHQLGMIVRKSSQLAKHRGYTHRALRPGVLSEIVNVI